MRVHAAYSKPHFREHLLAIWNHLPPDLRGHTVPLRRRALLAGRDVLDGDVYMVAAYDDIEFLPGSTPIIYVEHGAGQKYRNVTEHRARYYHGGQHPENVVAYISPRQSVADGWGRPAFAAGAPVCDPYPHRTGNTHPCAAITFHWDCRVCPETMSALPHWQETLPDLVAALQAQGFAVVGHHHPRDNRLPKVWRNLGVEIVDVATVRGTADLLIADNTSLMFEMAYLGRTVMCLTSPLWRRDVSHGLRFWNAIPGPQFDHPESLLGWDFRGEVCNLGLSQACAAQQAYDKPLSDGRDGERAAAWIAEFVATM